jgi:hypothetical protein
MSDNFVVNNPGLEEANYELNAAVGLAGQIIEDLNTYLSQMGQATQNSAVPLWQDLQTKWNGDYLGMVQRLENGHRASVDAHEWYKNGDLQSVRIMC